MAPGSWNNRVISIKHIHYADIILTALDGCCSVDCGAGAGDDGTGTVSVADDGGNDGSCVGGS